MKRILLVCVGLPACSSSQNAVPSTSSKAPTADDVAPARAKAKAAKVGKRGKVGKASATPPAAAHVAPADAGVGVLIDDPAYYGCGCGVAQPAPDNGIWIAMPAGEDIAFINLDGKNQRIPRKGAESHVGETRGPDVFSANGTVVTVTWTRPHTCEPADECESTLYDAVMQVERAGHPTMQVAGSGWCGC